MTISITPYLNFDGTTKDVMAWYQSVLGGALDVTLFKDMGGAPRPELADGVMHADLRIGDKAGLMASDAFDASDLVNGLSISLAIGGEATDKPELEARWAALSEGATVLQPLMAAPWGATVGMLIDRNGVRWLFNIPGAGA